MSGENVGKSHKVVVDGQLYDVADEGVYGALATSLHGIALQLGLRGDEINMDTIRIRINNLRRFGGELGEMVRASRRNPMILGTPPPDDLVGYATRGAAQQAGQPYDGAFQLVEGWMPGEQREVV